MSAAAENLAPGSPVAGFGRTAVVGGGLIGGSIARRLLELGRDVVVVDPDVGPPAAAQQVGLATAAAVADVDLVVLACPLDVMPAAMADVAAGAPHAVVIDVGSVKGAVLAAAQAAGLGGRFVGCHPMSGTEHSGFEASDAALLVGATWAVMHPDETAISTSSMTDESPGGEDRAPASVTRPGDPNALVAAVVRWLIGTFDATVVVVDAERHDRAVARVSHLPHAVANALLAVSARDDGDDADAAVAALLAAGSFRDGTRVAGRNAERTLNMLIENGAALAPALDAVIAELQAYRRELGPPIQVEALRRRLHDVVDVAAELRTSHLADARSDDLGAALANAAGRPLVVRAGERSGEDVDVDVVAVLEDRHGGGVA
ncbi:prephenate dehydrogenase/arogenate dehydrogenase family protein [Nocardioides sp. R-C-SC26]|uniref:prephenate dehydrogenase n=1 Tax=Nocardioides sp. R-C-SC26 TaxID=2870414 RepID=UPI001E30EB42|nr:prephenate dehydrogenase/arogenate dehydrogenase family protein [Nocardioides sp. R-C-SC26]